MKKIIIVSNRKYILKIIINWLLVIIWGMVIFCMSNMDSEKSNGKSKQTINTIIEKSVETTNEIGIIDNQPSEITKNQIVNKLNLPFRKIAHASEFCIFTILMINALKKSRITGKKVFIIAMLVCFMYACLDEYHQTFINGRTGQFSDSIIDTLGGFIGCIIIWFFVLLKKIFRK